MLQDMEFVEDDFGLLQHLADRIQIRDLRSTVEAFSAADYRRIFFVVHTPDADLATASGVPDHVEIVPPDRLARQALDAGLAAWIEDKVS